MVGARFGPAMACLGLALFTAAAAPASAAQGAPTLQEAERLTKALGRNATAEQKRNVAEYYTKVLARTDLAIKERGKALAGRGNLYLQLGMAEAAKRDFDAVVSIFPNEWPAWSMRADADAALGDVDLEISDLSKSIQLAPDSNILLERRGDAYYQNGKYEQAIDDYREVVRLHRQYGKQLLGSDLGTREPGLADIYNKLARAYSGLAKASAH